MACRARGCLPNLAKLQRGFPNPKLPPGVSWVPGVRKAPSRPLWDSVLLRETPPSAPGHTPGIRSFVPFRDSSAQGREMGEEAFFIDRSSEMATFRRGNQNALLVTHIRAEAPQRDAGIRSHPPATRRLVAQPRALPRGETGTEKTPVSREGGRGSFSDLVDLGEHLPLRQVQAVTPPPPHPTPQQGDRFSSESFQEPRNGGEGAWEGPSCPACLCESAKAGSHTRQLEKTSWEEDNELPPPDTETLHDPKGSRPPMFSTDK